MRRKLLFVLSVMASIVLMAADVTPQQALQEAQRFMQARSTANGRRAAATPQLELASRVSDLYVFNLSGDQGFVIVSNDDCAEAVLGYSDTGTFDPNNIPDNMRAWLQGYADEIAWAKSHNIQKTAGSASRRTASAVKTAIAPLVQTQWNQGAPYNNLCPYYGDTGSSYVYSASYISGYEHCATGCVATALAQVMYYNQWPTNATTAIPSYKWDNANVTLGGLTATTFDWGNMKTTYPATGTEEEVAAANTAIATLMKYCGYAVQMNYGVSSGASSSLIANALINNFGYNPTATFLNRSNYSYGNWIEIMYDELSKGRPVLYGGQSTGGGHEFIIDGYQSEDYFNVNWGWGGLSDGYFKLSALDSDEQGIGGSSSTDGYRYNQDAVVGIQKSTESGTLIEGLTTTLKNNFSLSVTSISVSDSPTQYQEVEVTLNVANSGNDEYDGELGLEVLYQEGEDWYSEIDAYGIFVIPAKGSKVCTITFTPQNYGNYRVRAFRGGYYLGNIFNFTVAAGGGGGYPQTSNITLGRSIVVDNSEGNNFYGSVFKGTLTVINPESDKIFYGLYQFDIYDNEHNLRWRFNDYITIPASGSIDIPFTLTGTTPNTSYVPNLVYYKNGSWTDWDVVGTYTCKPGIIQYNADGTMSMTKVPDSKIINISSGTYAVNIVGAGITSATSAEPNCIFIKGSTDAAITGATNVITYNGATYTADNITLTDGSGFYSPVDFTATNVEFTYSNDRWADGAKGWNTIMLPFDVTSVTANGTAIDWFHSGSDTGKQFWLKEFTSDAASTVNFDYTDAMKANTPYIIALPGNHWGSNWDLSSKTIKFIGENTTVHKGGTLSTVTGSNYRFVGNTVQDATENIYTINNDGNSFELKATGGCAPFRAFFKPGTFDRSVTSLGIGNGANTTGINEVRGQKEEVRGQYFDLQGRKVAKPTKGFYIVNGKKVVIK